MLTVQNILVGTDFSQASRAALDYARALARTFRARLHILHVVEPALAGTFDIDGRLTPLPELQFALENSERERLEHMISEDDRVSLRAVTAVRTLDTPAHAIIEYASTHHIDMIVVGTHGRRGVAYLVVGSVAEQVVRSAHCPVVTIRQGFEALPQHHEHTAEHSVKPS